jgi:hypothetical protein
VSLAGTETISGSKTLSGTTTFTGSIVANSLTITPTELGYIDGLTSNAQTQITARVSLTGNETIAGIKTFSSLPESSVAPTTGNQLTNKTYVDAAIGGSGSVTLAGTQTITGDKTFSGTTTYTGNIVANALTITPTELGYIATLTSDAQTQITARASIAGTETISGSKTFSGTTTFTGDVVANALTITPTELGFIAGLTSDAQTQITARASIAGTETISGSKTFSGTTTFTGDIVANALTITPTELGFIDGLTSNAQTQITARALDSAVVHLAGTETITGTKTFTSTLTVDTANRDTIFSDTGISTSHPVSGTSFSVNSTDLSSINATNTLSAGTVNNITNVGLAVGSTAIANSISTTGGYNRITSATSSTLANEITATGGGGNSMTTTGAGTTVVRSLDTGTALFFTNSGKNTIGSTSGLVEVSTNNTGSSGILIQNTNTGAGGIRIENDGATGSLVLDSAGTLNANTSTGKNSLSSTTGAIELITGSSSATGINIENTNATTGGIRLKTNGTTGDIDILCVDNIRLTTSGAAGEIELTSASTAAAAILLENSSSGGISLKSARNTTSGINIENTGASGGIQIRSGSGGKVALGQAATHATIGTDGVGAVGYYVGASGAASFPLVYPVYWFSTQTTGQTTSQCRVGSFANNDTTENFIRYRVPFKSKIVGMSIMSDQETINASQTYIHISIDNATGLDTTPTYGYWIVNAGAGASNLIDSSTISGSVVSVADIPADTTFFLFLAFGSTGTSINVVGTARTVPSEFQVHLYLQQVP